ncbi:hypothetical protein X975_01366, partial [Stegodyphus mimosarum]
DLLLISSKINSEQEEYKLKRRRFYRTSSSRNLSS